MIRAGLCFCFAFVAALVRAEGYWDRQLNPQTLASVPHEDGRIAVWEHATKPGRYYAMPLVYLLGSTARTKSNILTGVEELSFDVLMWSEEALEIVYLYLKAEYNSSVTRERIEMLPMEKIRIVWKDTIRPISPDFKLMEQWKSNTHLPSVVTFQFTCSNRERCDKLKMAMKATQDIFNALELEYVINGQRSARRRLTVTGRDLTRGKLWTKMASMTGAVSDVRYLTADDLKTVTSESVNNVIGTLITDSDYVDTGDEVSMNDVLQRVLSRHQVTSDNFEPHMWNSVFWDKTWTRPDKLTKYLNQILAKDTSDSKTFLLNEQSRSGQAEGGGGISFLDIFNISGSGGSSSASKTKVQKEDVVKTLRERHNNIEWTGDVFRVKPMKLFRLNLSMLNISNKIATANIQVRRYESVHTIKLRVSGASPQTPNLTPQLVMSRLSEKLNQVKTSVTATIARLVPIQDKLKTLPGWPNGGYCILAKGECPPGFTRHSGYIKGIKNPGNHHNSYISAVNFGNSNISCFNACGSNADWKVDIFLVSCCK